MEREAKYVVCGSRDARFNFSAWGLFGNNVCGKGGAEERLYYQGSGVVLLKNYLQLIEVQ